MNANGPYCQQVNIGSGNGSVPSGNSHYPTNVDTDLSCHVASLGHSDLIFA